MYPPLPHPHLSIYQHTRLPHFKYAVLISLSTADWRGGGGIIYYVQDKISVYLIYIIYMFHSDNKLLFLFFISRFDFACMPIIHPRLKREFIENAAKNRTGPLTRSDLCLSSSGTFSFFIIMLACSCTVVVFMSHICWN